MGLIDKVEKKVKKKVLNEVEDWFEDRFDDVTDAFDDIESAAKEALRLGKESRNRIDYLRNQGIASRARKAIHELGEELVNEFKEKLTDEILDGMADALDEAADVVEIAAPSNFTLIFGAEIALVIQCEITVQLSMPNPVARLTEIRAWAKEPPKGRSEIIQCIKDFGPESIGVEAKVSGNGLAMGWDGEEKYDRVDEFLKKHGVK